MPAQLIAIAAPVFICAGLGYAWVRLGRAYETEMVTSLVMTIGGPCLVFSTITGIDLEAAVFGRMVLGTVLALLLGGALGWAVLRLLGLSVRAFLPAVTLPNCGNMGLPLSLFAFGEQGLGLAIGAFMVCSVTQFTVGAAIASGSFRPTQLLRIPLLYAVVAGLFFLLTGLQPPAWAARTTEILGGMTIPLMLITLGVSLARLRVGDLRRSFGLAVFRLLGGVAVGTAVAFLLGLEGTARGVMILQVAMPTAVFNYLLAQYFKTRAEEVAGLVVVSTLLSFATLPALLWYALKLSG